MTDADLIKLSDKVGLTYDGGKNGLMEDADISEFVILFARTVQTRSVGAVPGTLENPCDTSPPCC